MSKTIIVTGATGAIGKATAMELAKSECQLILMGRNADKLESVRSEIEAESKNANISAIVADLSEPNSIRQAVDEIRKKWTSVNALINIAGIFKSKRLVNSVGNEYMLATNHLGPFLLTNELLQLLKAGRPSRIITVSAPSTTKINFEDINWKGKFSAGFLGAFGASKMMNLMFTYELSRRLEGTGVTASVFHPGLVKSELTREMPAILNFIFKKISSKPDKAAKMLCKLAIDPEFGDLNGKFMRFDGKEMKSSKYSYDRNLQETLWSISEQLTK